MQYISTFNVVFFVLLSLTLALYLAGFAGSIISIKLGKFEQFKSIITNRKIIIAAQLAWIAVLAAAGYADLHALTTYLAMAMFIGGVVGGYRGYKRAHAPMADQYFDPQQLTIALQEAARRGWK